MNFSELSKKASNAIDEIEKYIGRYGTNEVIASIKQQMIFIKEKAILKQNPVLALHEKKFTYGVLSSREFSSPDEMRIKKLLDDVSRILDDIA